MSTILILVTSEAEKLHISKWPKYCGTPCNRKVCAARFSVVRKEHSNKTVLTGCTAMPSPESPFCVDHVHAETPVLLGEKITKTTRSKLLAYKAARGQQNGRRGLQRGPILGYWAL